MTIQMAQHHAIQSHEHNNNAGSPRSALALQLKSGQIIDVFPSDVVEPIRYMITQGVQREQFPKCISVISSMPQEGVTYISRALATTLAHDTRRMVCWVDLNWWSPDIKSHQLLQQYSSITDVLYHKSPLEKALIPTRNPFLNMVVAGRIDMHQRPVLSRSKYLKSFIAALTQRFDYVLLDIPAIKSSSDAIALAGLGEKCCVVVQQGATQTRVVGEVLSEIEHMPVMGVLMNRVQYKTPEWIRNFIASN